jgi:hypothetical protein
LVDQRLNRVRVVDRDAEQVAHRTTRHAAGCGIDKAVRGGPVVGGDERSRHGPQCSTGSRFRQPNSVLVTR